ncbi:hypothetical protein TSUD_305390 [Trifolium subterraneum]|uniref:BZIP domain-containing protein n=1 Tax=Trifolium subterraneum TaxID=3900 RepID=A0A2Z6NBS3_TRISU|nr:hypothetical protein TSUD_305390 [Trifolium subterraneum]
MNFKGFGNDPGASAAAAGGGVGRTTPGNFPLARQPSVYSLTVDEFMNSMGGSGKDFGSMNMDELLKNIWTAEEVQTMGGEEAINQLQRQGSLTLPRTLSQKTVDEVWKDISKDYGPNLAAPQAQRQPTLGEMTLEEFLVRAGVVREDAKPNDEVFLDLARVGNNGNLGLAFQPQQMNKVGGFMGNNRLNGGGIGMVGLAPGAVQIGAGSPANQLSSDQMGKSNGDTSSVSPVPYVFNGGMRGRKSNGAVEKVIERRQRRMIKNRESAARSRARKQAYTMELEAEVAKLKEENEELQKKQEEIMEIQKNQMSQVFKAQRVLTLCPVVFCDYLVKMS